ncbi:MAG TPA: beta-ketoacyl-[acyl-carrier-protein] synthase family protein [Kiritimatiellia bacterium]|nr:beta-ketoacyl-[acyl-carrier-protein] synthase family protein [Kiritimatiellia bacterium]
MKAPIEVVVTGMGIVAPTGIGLDVFWDSLIRCKSGIGPITLLDVTNFPLKYAGEVKNFDLRKYYPSAKPKRMARQTQLALVACRMAIEHAGLTLEQLQGNGRINMIMGISSGGTDVIAEGMEMVLTVGADRVRPYMVGACQPHAIGATLVHELGLRASVKTLSEACPSSLSAIAMAAQVIKAGQADLIIAGGADSPLNSAALAGFAAGGLPTRSTEFPPEEMSRPFDAKRSGVVLSEGAGFVVLERMDVALARGATPYMEILGGATAIDMPGAGGMEGLWHSMNLALENAGVYPDQVDYICANAYGDPAGDRIETDFIKRCFGDRAYRMPVSSMRGVLGHALSAAGMSQVIACALMMRRQQIVPTANLRFPDPDCDLDYVPLIPRPGRVGMAMANSHGIGGENATLLLKAVE